MLLPTGCENATVRGTTLTWEQDQFHGILDRPKCYPLDSCPCFLLLENISFWRMSLVLKTKNKKQREAFSVALFDSHNPDAFCFQVSPSVLIQKWLLWGWSRCYTMVVEIFQKYSLRILQTVCLCVPWRLLYVGCTADYNIEVLIAFTVKNIVKPRMTGGWEKTATLDLSLQHHGQHYGFISTQHSGTTDISERWILHTNLR